VAGVEEESCERYDMWLCCVESLEPHVCIFFSVIDSPVRHFVIGAVRDTWSGWTGGVPVRPWGESEVVGYRALVKRLE
jgi:hypothetical protein